MAAQASEQLEKLDRKYRLPQPLSVCGYSFFFFLFLNFVFEFFFPPVNGPHEY